MLDLITHNLVTSNDTIKIFPISDLHVGDKALDKRLFREFANKIATTENYYCLLVGDLMNNAIVGSVSNTYNEEMPPREQLKWLREELIPLKKKILGIVSGNHEYRSKKATDTDLTEELAEYLDLKHLYRDDELVVKISFGKINNAGNPATYTIYMTHGSGGGKMSGGKLNNIQSLVHSCDNADIYLTGHGHDKIGNKLQPRRIDYRHNKIVNIEKGFAMTGHWSEFFGGYAARGMFRPTATGPTIITLYGDKKYFELTI